MRAQETPAPAETLITPTRSLSAAELYELWEYRDLIRLLFWRDVKVRYRQTLLGIGWVVLQPLVSLSIFTLIFSKVLAVPTDGAPYPIFAGLALIPWSYFAAAVSRAATSLAASAGIVTKVYFPRLAVPLAAALAPLVDLAVGSVVIIAIGVYFAVPLTPAVLLLPLVAAATVVTALAFGLWLAALNARYRDVGHLLPFLLQVWLYATPVLYNARAVPEPYRSLLYLNPMTTIVEVTRSCVLGRPYSGSVAMAAASGLLTLAVLVIGLLYFRATERTLADVV